MNVIKVILFLVMNLVLCMVFERDCVVKFGDEIDDLVCKFYKVNLLYYFSFLRLKLICG